MAATLAKSPVSGSLADVMADIKLEKRHHQALERLQELVVPEADAAAQWDLQSVWTPKILKAIKRGKSSVTNKWFGAGRSDQKYLEALQKLLGPTFLVYFDDTLMGNGWTRVSW